MKLNYTKAQFLRHTLAGIFTLSLVFFASLQGPQIHNLYVASKLEDNTVQLITEDGRGGGTGFYVRFKGKTKMLTNAHVCGASKKMHVIAPGDETDYKSVAKIPAVKVIKQDVFKDLCMLEPFDKKIKGLAIADGVDKFDRSYTLGFPLGVKIFSKGLIQETITQTKTFPNLAPEACPGFFVDIRKIKPQNEAHAMQLFMMLFQGVITLCDVDQELLVISNIINYGSSGSPVVDVFGNLIGVVTIAIGENAMAGGMVRRIDFVDFLSD